MRFIGFFCGRFFRAGKEKRNESKKMYSVINNDDSADRGSDIGEYIRVG